MKEQKGITLIALIITIIVMLILVVVTINMAVNGGLFAQAKTASEGTQKQAEKEQMISAVLDALDSQGNFVRGNVQLPAGVKWCTDEEAANETAYAEIQYDQSAPTNWVITENNNRFYIDANGSVLDEKPETPETNVWKARGLTSEYVTYGQDYLNSDYDLEMNFHEDGSMKGMKLEEVEEALNYGIFVVGQDYLLIIDDDDEDEESKHEYTLFVFDGVGTLTAYKCPVSESVQPTKSSIMNYEGTTSIVVPLEQDNNDH